jgi:putative transcriptional regulator
MGRQPRTDADRVHDRIAVLRADRRVSRKQLADAVGVHPQTIGYLERGEYSPSLALALRIARFFDLPVEEVFSLDPLPSLTDALTRRTS